MLIWLFAVIVAATLIARDCPDVPLGRKLFQLLVTAPAAWLEDLSLRKAFAVVVIILFFLAAPEFAVLLGTDMTLFLEALAATSLVAAQLRLSDLVKRLTALPRRMTLVLRRPASRAPPEAAARREKPRRAPPPIDPEPAGWAFA